MLINTTSSAISFSKELEESSAKFYDALARTYKKDVEIWEGFAKENRKTVTNIERTYYSVITDALEGCFAFDMDTDAYQLKPTLAKNLSYNDAIKQALENEKKTVDFYKLAEEQSRATMADIPMVFRTVVKKRNERIAKLQSLLV